MKPVRPYQCRQLCSVAQDEESRIDWIEGDEQLRSLTVDNLAFMWLLEHFEK